MSSLTLQWVALLGILALARSQSGHLEVAEATISTNVGNPTGWGWQSFIFMKEFPEVPVVIAMTDTGSVGIADESASEQPQQIRLRQITTTGFQASTAEPTGADGIVGTNTFTYLAASVGIWDLNGFTVQVGRINTTERVAAQCRPLTFPNTGWQDVTFEQVFAEAPAFLAYIQTSENEIRLLPSAAPSVPWLVTGVKSVTATGAKVTLDSSKATDPGSGNLVPETIGYIAFGNGANGSIEVARGLLEVQYQNGWMTCSPGTWLSVFSEKTLAGCLRHILARADCSKLYINFGDDGNCGCISPSTDCREISESSTYLPYANIYRVTHQH